MSRSGYHDDYCEDNWAAIRWRGAVASAIRGRHGQAFLREMLAAMDALPEKRLIRQEFVKDGAVCALGAVAQARGVDFSDVDPDDYEACRSAASSRLGIPDALAAEVMYENDEYAQMIYDVPTEPSRHRPHLHFRGRAITPEERFTKVREWVVSNLRDEE